MLGKKQLEHLLQRLGLMREGASLPQALPEVWQARWGCAHPSAALDQPH